MGVWDLSCGGGGKGFQLQHGLYACIYRYRCMYVYEYTYTYMYVYIYVCTHTYVYIYMCVCVCNHVQQTARDSIGCPWHGGRQLV